MKDTGKGGKTKTKKQKGILIDSLNYYRKKKQTNHIRQVLTLIKASIIQTPSRYILRVFSPIA